MAGDSVRGPGDQCTAAATAVAPGDGVWCVAVRRGSATVRGQQIIGDTRAA